MSRMKAPRKVTDPSYTEDDLQQDLDSLVAKGLVQEVKLPDGTKGYRLSLAAMEPKGRA